MYYKDKLIYEYLVDRGIGLVVICVIICCFCELICNYPNPLTVNINITNPYLSMFFGLCLGYGFIEITGRLIAGITFCIYKLTTYIYRKL